MAMADVSLYCVGHTFTAGFKQTLGASLNSEIIIKINSQNAVFVD
jgi:hypothetical protein